MIIAETIDVYNRKLLYSAPIGSFNSLRPAILHLVILYFRPLYRDCIDIAYRHGKMLFMHSDSHTLHIIPKLLDPGLDVMNTQLFCLGIEKLRHIAEGPPSGTSSPPQHLLPYGTPKQSDAAVQSVYDNLWQEGGCIAQCEFGPDSQPENVFRIYDKWSSLR